MGADERQPKILIQCHLKAAGSHRPCGFSVIYVHHPDSACPAKLNTMSPVTTPLIYLCSNAGYYQMYGSVQEGAISPVWLSRSFFFLKSLLDSKIARNSLQEASFALTGLIGRYNSERSFAAACISLMFSENSREWLYLPGGPRLSWIDHFYTWFYNDSAGSWHSALSPRLMLIIISPLNLSRRIHLSEWCDLIGHSSLVQFDPMRRVSFPEFGCEAYFQPILNSTSKRFDSSKNWQAAFAPNTPQGI